MSLAGLPFKLAQRAQNIHHLSTTRPPSDAVDVMTALAHQLHHMREGFIAWDAKTKGNVLAVPCVYAILADNPMSCELCGIMISSSANHPCRACEVLSNHNRWEDSLAFYNIGRARMENETQERIKQQMQMALAGVSQNKLKEEQSKHGVKCKWSQKFIDAMYSGVLSEGRNEWLAKQQGVLSSHHPVYMSPVWFIKGERLWHQTIGNNNYELPAIHRFETTSTCTSGAAAHSSIGTNQIHGDSDTEEHDFSCKVSDAC